MVNYIAENWSFLNWNISKVMKIMRNQSAFLTLSKKELQWWVDNVHTANGRPITSILSLEDFQQDLYSDASKKGWGCALAVHGKIIQRCSGQWSVNEAKEHINYLELQAILFGLRCFRDLLPQSVHTHCDNTTAELT